MRKVDWKVNSLYFTIEVKCFCFGEEYVWMWYDVDKRIGMLGSWVKNLIPLWEDMGLGSSKTLRCKLLIFMSPMKLLSGLCMFL